MEFMGIGSVAGISVICYLIGLCVKASPLDDRFIPLVCGLLGGVLGLLGMKCMAAFPAEDYITAAAVGIVSGLAATGADQIFKQLNS